MPALEIAYLHYGEQSGVTRQVSAALERRGHRVRRLQVVGPLEWRHPDRRLRIAPAVAAHLLQSAFRFGRHALEHRWNTLYAFEVHSTSAERLLESLPDAPDVVLQNGALFSPGLAPSRDYVLLLDHTRELSMRRPAFPDAGLAAALDYGPIWRAREQRLYRDARAIATFSRGVAESLQRDYGADGERIHIVGAGANVLPEAPVRADDGRTLLFVGKDFRRKGGRVLLRAFERVRRTFPDARLLVAGPHEPLSLPEGATPVGFVPPEKLPDLFAQATVFVLPTLREPFGLAFLDAMACGLPCVGTLVEAVPEVIVPDETGVLVPAGDHVELARAIIELLSSPDRGRGMGKAGRARVLAGFTWDHVAARLEDCLAPGTQTAGDVSRATSVA